MVTYGLAVTVASIPTAMKTITANTIMADFFFSRRSTQNGNTGKNDKDLICHIPSAIFDDVEAMASEYLSLLSMYDKEQYY